ncbi:MAG TPA: beta-propeller domain-containing protein [Candidatus Thalassarchaeaceae archaeon]|nr:beta-propeller domain-containing protein [Candidatus Thalassarchaeaceae archaeon]
MFASKLSSVLLILVLLSSGCLGAVDEGLDIVDEIIDDVEDALDLLEGDYPRLDLPERTRSSPNLQQYDACESLLDDLKQSVFDEMVVSLDQESYWHWAPGPWMAGGLVMEADGAVAEMAVADDGFSSTESSTTTSSTSREGDFSGTNNQESGVDEADFLKTDGFHIYMLNGQLLLIMGVPEFGNLTLESNLTIEGNPTQMMLDGDRLLIASSINYWNLQPDSDLRELMYDDSDTHTRARDLVKYTVVDISDRSSPTMERELYIEGNYQTARMVDGTVRSITHLWTYFDGVRSWVELPSDYWSEEDIEERMDLWNQSLNQTINHNERIISNLTLDDFVPHIYEFESGNLKTHAISKDQCSEFAASSDSAGRGFTSIMSIKMLNDEVSIEVDHITSSWSHVYSSEDTLVLAEPANDWWWFWRNSGWDDATNIHSFDISDANQTIYLASGRVNGTVQDQFSLSEHQGSIRVASTTDLWGRWWLSTEVDEAGEPVWTGPSNQVTILQDDGEGDLSRVGFIGGIAEGETIWSARFVGDRGYLVTFMNIDPLWVIDLSDPTNPTILGELEVPGVSTYIHPIDENSLLTIGIAGGEDGLGLDWSTTQVSLFDVSDTSKPKLSDTIPLSPAFTDENCDTITDCGWSWSNSEATYEHKAFTYWAPDSLLAVPLSTYRYVYDEVEIDGRVYSHYGYQYVSMLKTIHVDTQNGTLSNHGEVNHSAFYNDEELSYWWSGSTSIRRSIFMGDYVYAFSPAGATVHRTDDLQLMVELPLPQPTAYNYYKDEPVAVESEDSASTPSVESSG